MSRQIRVAVTQMDPAPAPVAERLGRAARLVEGAAAQRAELVVLPEVFNTGYIYDEGNYALAEPLDGRTAGWMCQAAERYNLHLAGSLLLQDGGEIYNALMLFAPDGRSWRYDKCYPWGWERAYFRPGRSVTVAETALGRIGMLICWDVAHLELWQAYAGRVDLILASSCPPDVSNPVYILPDGTQVTLGQVGLGMAKLSGIGALVFGRMLEEQAAWLGVPAVNAMGTGYFTTPIPRGKALILSMFPKYPRLLRYLSRANQIRLSCPMLPGCRVVDEQGHTLAEVNLQAGEALAVTAVSIGDETPKPNGVQPPSPLPRMAYDLSDRLLPRLMLPLYRKGVRNVR